MSCQTGVVLVILQFCIKFSNEGGSWNHRLCEVGRDHCGSLSNLHWSAPDLTNYVVRLLIFYLVCSSWLKLMMKWGEALKLHRGGQNCYFQTAFVQQFLQLRLGTVCALCCLLQSSKALQLSWFGLCSPSFPLSGSQPCTQCAAGLLRAARLPAHHCALPHRHFLKHFRNVLVL